MTVDEYRNVVGNIPALRKLGERLRDRVSEILVEIATERTFEAGEILYEKDSADENSGAILLDGVLEVTRNSGDKIQVPAPDLMGEMQQFNDNAKRTATVCAKTQSLTLVFFWHNFVKALQDNPTISQDEQTAIKSAFTGIAAIRLKELKG